MNNSKQIDTFKHYPSRLMGQLITERAPIHTYNYSKAIRGAKPYIRFIYIETDTLPTVTSIPFDRPDLYKLFIDDTQQVELHVVYPEDSGNGYDSEIPGVHAHSFEGKVGAMEKTISCKASDTALRLSVDYVFLSIIEQKASLSAVIDLDEKGKVISTVPYMFHRSPVHITNAATGEKKQYESHNHSLGIIEPYRLDYRVSRTRSGSKIVRYHRYSGADHIVFNQANAEISGEIDCSTVQNK